MIKRWTKIRHTKNRAKKSDLSKECHNSICRVVWFSNQVWVLVFQALWIRKCFVVKVQETDANLWIISLCGLKISLRTWLWMEQTIVSRLQISSLLVLTLWEWFSICRIWERPNPTLHSLTARCWQTIWKLELKELPSLVNSLMEMDQMLLQIKSIPLRVWLRIQARSSSTRQVQ